MDVRRPGALSFAASFFEQFAGCYAQGRGDFFEDHDGGIADTPLDPADVCPVKTALERQFFLRKSAFLPKFADV
jgi:hypothetical protein